MTLATRFTPFILVALIFMASLVHAAEAPQYHLADKAIGLMVVNPGNLTLDVFAEPDETSQWLGTLNGKAELAEGDASNVYMHSQREEANPDAGLFDRKTKLIITEHFLDTYVSPTGVVGVYMMENRGNWIRVDTGWINRGQAEGLGIVLLEWDALLKNDAFPEFRLLENEDGIADVSRTDVLRRKAHFIPIGSIPVFKSIGDSAPSIITESPMRFAIIGKDPDGDRDLWLNVFVLMGRCDNAAGKSDYREGTVGWIRTRNEYKAPTIMKLEERC